MNLGGPGADGFAEYRAAVNRLATRWSVAGNVHPARGDLLRDAVAEPALPPVLDALPGGMTGTVTHLEREVRAFQPTARSNVRTPAEFVRLLFLQQIDVLWWSSRDSFADDDAVRSCPELVSLPGLRRAGLIDFHFKSVATSWSTRARNYAVRRWAPQHEPRTSGLSYDVARPAMVGLLNEVAARFSAAAPGWSRGLWVNCLVRSEAVQQHLRELGYSAADASSHCVGYAADVEMDWLDRHGQVDALRGVLVGLRDAGTINLIDEGQAWHVCLNPARVAHYEDELARTAAVRGSEVRPCAG